MHGGVASKHAGLGRQVGAGLGQTNFGAHVGHG